MAKKLNTPFINADGYRFVDPDSGSTTAILEQSGRLSLRDDEGRGSLEVFESWQDFIKSMQDTPVKSTDERDILAQLSNIGLGRCEPIYREVNESAAARSAPDTEGKEDAMAAKVKETTAKIEKIRKEKAAKAPVKAKKEPAVKELKDCVCGCGEQTTRNFRQGHDARVHGWQKKIERGDMKFSDIDTKHADVAVKYLKSIGVKQGVKAKDAA